jgi:hypothetical protein
MSKEGSPIGYQNEVKFEKSGSAVVMVATTTQREAFLSEREALAKIQKRLKNKHYKNIAMGTLAVLGLLGGAGITIHGTLNNNLIEAEGGVLVNFGSASFLPKAYKGRIEYDQLEWQEKEIKSIIDSNK